MSFETAAGDLHDFFVMAGTGAAALVGLLFVGLSLHLKTVTGASEIRALARVTLSNFGTVLLVSMFLAIREPAIAAGWQLIVTSLISMAVAGPALLRALRTPQIAPGLSLGNRVRLLLRFVFSGVGYVGVLVSGLLLLLSSLDLYVILIEVTIVLLILISLRNSWDLVTVGDVVVEDGRG